MLTGRRPFDGEDVSDTLALVLKGRLTGGALPADTPSVDSHPDPALSSERDRRQASAATSAVARLEIADAIGARRTSPRRPAPAARASVAPLDVRRGRLWSTAAVAVDAAGRHGECPGAGAGPCAWPVELGADADPATLLGPALALSPDGSTVAVLG